MKTWLFLLPTKLTQIHLGLFLRFLKFEKPAMTLDDAMQRRDVVILEKLILSHRLR